MRAWWHGLSEAQRDYYRTAFGVAIAFAIGLTGAVVYSALSQR